MTDVNKLIEQAEEALAPRFKEIEKRSERHTARVLEAFRNNRVSEATFASTNGYGLDDTGRDTLDKIYAEVFGCEAAFVRHSIVSGTHALTIGLFALLRPGDLLLDFFAGSGSFGEAALRHGRRCILVDNNPAAMRVLEKRFTSIFTEWVGWPAEKQP